MTGLFRVIFQFLWGRFNSIFFWTFVVWKLNWVILSSSGSFITWKAYSNTPMFLDHVPGCFPAKFRNKSTNKNKGTRTSTRLFLTTVWKFFRVGLILHKTWYITLYHKTWYDFFGFVSQINQFFGGKLQVQRGLSNKIWKFSFWKRYHLHFEPDSQILLSFGIQIGNFISHWKPDHFLTLFSWKKAS